MALGEHTYSPVRSGTRRLGARRPVHQSLPYSRHLLSNAAIIFPLLSLFVPNLNASSRTKQDLDLAAESGDLDFEPPDRHRGEPMRAWTVLQMIEVSDSQCAPADQRKVLASRYMRGLALRELRSRVGGRPVDLAGPIRQRQVCRCSRHDTSSALCPA